jgi:hypothetical protein
MKPYLGVLLEITLMSFAHVETHLTTPAEMLELAKTLI